MQSVYSSMDANLYNVQNYITILEDLKKYDFPFTRKNQIKEQLTGGKDDPESDDEEEKKEEPQIEEVTDEKAEEIKKNEEEKKQPKVEDELMEKMKGTTIDLGAITEGDEGAADKEVEDRQLLAGFKKLNVKIHMLAEEDITTLRTKSRYAGLFDLGVLSLQSVNHAGEDMAALFKDKARVFTETADLLLMLK